MVKLNKEEKELLAFVEKGEWKSARPTGKELQKYLQYARNTLDVLSDKNLMRQIRASEREIRRGARRYSFEEIFGEPLNLKKPRCARR